MRIVANIGTDKVRDQLDADRWDIAAAKLSLFEPSNTRQFCTPASEYRPSMARCLGRTTKSGQRVTDLDPRGVARQVERRLADTEICAAVSSASLPCFQPTPTLRPPLRGNVRLLRRVYPGRRRRRDLYYRRKAALNTTSLPSGSKINGGALPMATRSRRAALALERAKQHERVYTHALHQVFADMEEGTACGSIVDSGTVGIRGTQIWGKLYRFQTDGVIGAIDKLMRLVWGILSIRAQNLRSLGRDQAFELRNERVLVLARSGCGTTGHCGSKTIAAAATSFAGDRLAYDVLNHTDLSRTRGYSGEIDLEHINWATTALW